MSVQPQRRKEFSIFFVVQLHLSSSFLLLCNLSHLILEWFVKLFLGKSSMTSIIKPFTYNLGDLNNLEIVLYCIIDRFFSICSLYVPETAMGIDIGTQINSDSEYPMAVSRYVTVLHLYHSITSLYFAFPKHYIFYTLW
jgi:hypothetical protein